MLERVVVTGTAGAILSICCLFPGAEASMRVALSPRQIFPKGKIKCIISSPLTSLCQALPATN